MNGLQSYEQIVCRRAFVVIALSRFLCPSIIRPSVIILAEAKRYLQNEATQLARDRSGSVQRQTFCVFDLSRCTGERNRCLVVERHLKRSCKKVRTTMATENSFIFGLDWYRLHRPGQLPTSYEALLFETIQKMVQQLYRQLQNSVTNPLHTTHR